MAFVATVFTTSQAGGLMTNTNYHIAFDRMMARGASFDIDAAYSNPAGLAWGHEGFQLSINFQKPWPCPPCLPAIARTVLPYRL